jgi:NADPH2:quinone reductase
VAVFAGSGGLAPEGAFPAGRAVRLPDGMPFETAAAFQVAYGTSHLALTRRARLAAGERLLVLGAAGGVGLTAVEIGRRLGARVIAIARGEQRLQVAAAAGAHHLIDADAPDVADAVKALGGADVIFDPVGGAAFTRALKAARPEARVLVIGFASGEVPEIRANHLLVKNIDVIGFYWGGYLRFAPAALRDSLATLLDWWREGLVRPQVSHVLPFDETPAALDLLRRRAATGKVVVAIGPQ